MHLFGLTFLLYFLKLPVGNGFHFFLQWICLHFACSSSILDSRVTSIISNLTDILIISNQIDFATVADDNTLYECISGLTVIQTSIKLKRELKNILQWFHESCVKSKADKCYLLTNSSHQAANYFQQFGKLANQCFLYRNLRK